MKRMFGFLASWAGSACGNAKQSIAVKIQQRGMVVPLMVDD
jgi:hypothetical protein